MQRVRAKQLESICPDWNTTLIRLEHLWLSRNFMPKWQLWRSSISGGLPVWWGERRKWSDLSDVARDVILFSYIFTSVLHDFKKITVIFSVGLQFTVATNKRLERLKTSIFVKEKGLKANLLVISWENALLLLPVQSNRSSRSSGVETHLCGLPFVPPHR